MRGKPVYFRRRRLPSRIIPAHAGQTPAGISGANSPADHPRACGANVSWSSNSRAPSGSSPRMRGKHHRYWLRVDTRRIIPAHAGQTVVDKLFGKTLPDHPRACGANLSVTFHQAATSGSSPRMRGKPNRSINNTAAQRIIPAHAGQTVLLILDIMIPPDHPRACGANHMARVVSGRNKGSSPRMRGKP